MDKVVHVHPGGSGLELTCDTDSPLVVLGVDTSSETVCSIVGELDDLLFCLELGDGNDGTEDLLTHDLHVGLYISEDGGFDEVTGSSGLSVFVDVASKVQSCALGFARLDVA